MDKVEIVIGVDVSKVRLDVAVLPDQSIWSVANDPLGTESLTSRRRLRPRDFNRSSTGTQ
jgi:hypothetical protein